MHNQFKAQVLCVRSNNALELGQDSIKKLYHCFGIIHHTPCAYSPQQNGIMERKHMHLLKTARALHIQACPLST